MQIRNTIVVMDMQNLHPVVQGSEKILKIYPQQIPMTSVKAKSQHLPKKYGDMCIF